MSVKFVWSSVCSSQKKIFNVNLFLSFCFVEPPPDDDDDQDGYLEPGCEYTILLFAHLA